MFKKYLLITLLLIVFLLIIAGLFYLENFSQFKKSTVDFNATPKIQAPTATQTLLNTPIKENVDYDVLTTAPAPNPENKDNKIKVVEFFSSECPGCKYFEPALNAWEEANSDKVELIRIPVIFATSWRPLAKAHYVAKTLEATGYPGLFKKIHADLYTAIQDQKRDLSNEAAMADFFVERSVKREDFLSAYQFSPVIEAQMAYAQNVANTDKIVSIPTVVIENKYRVTAVQAKDNPRFIQIINYLINKVSQEKKAH